jgi:transcriptional regulator of met regulon
LTRSFVEEVNADAVVVMWTDRCRNSTRIFRHDFGNKLLCDALIAHAVTQQCSESEEE